MRRSLMIFTIILLGGGFLSAQSLSTELLYQKYKGEEGVVSIRLPRIAIRLASAIADLDKEEKALLKSIRSLHVLTIENAELYPNVNFADEVRFMNGKNGYQLLLEVNDGEEDVLICGRQKNGKLKDLLIIVGGDDNVMVHIKGRLNGDMIQSLADVAGLDNINYLSQL